MWRPPRPSSRPPASRSRRCGTPASATAPASAIPTVTASCSTTGTHRMSRHDALAAYDRLPIPDTTEEHWRFTDLRGFDPGQFTPVTVTGHESVTGMLDLDVSGYARVSESGIEISQAPDGVRFEPLPEDFDRLYSLVEPDLDVESIGRHVSLRMSQLSQLRGRRIRLVVEPGRAIVATSGTLLVKVVSVK